MTPTCATHNRPLICPCCIGARGGAKGGKVSSPRKTRAARRNARKPRPHGLFDLGILAAQWTPGMWKMTLAGGHTVRNTRDPRRTQWIVA